MREEESYMGFWAASMLGLAVLFGLTMGIAGLIGMKVLSWSVLILLFMEMVLVMGTGIFLINRRRRYLVAVSSACEK